MKRLQLEQDNFLSKSYLKSIIIPAIAGIIMLFASCEQSNIEIINTITSESNAPTLSVTNTEILFTKNALIEVKIISKQINRYLNVEEPYTEFPQGLYVEFYDSTQTVTSYIKANYCIYDETEKLWTAENDVVSVSDEGNTLNTEFLIWDERKGKIYSDRYVRITNEDGIIHGKGFEANQDLSNWKIKKTSGTINIDNEK
ncbi:MAG: LPS export ABC transporter periplasmic protein LptC [Bacteroidales bacterium]|nr:LPS export ABC transporter periplasmic protein LptC [Bacteroidales bacterium]